MAEREPSFWDYVKRAFFARRRVPILGHVPINVLALLGVGVLGIALSGVWLIGAGLEVAYLAWLSQNPRFRDLVKGERLLATAQTWEQRLQFLVSRLTPEGKNRWQALARKCDLLRDLGVALGTVPLRSIDSMQESGLNSLLFIHARLLLQRETMLAFLKESSYRELPEKLADSEKRRDASKSEAVRRSLEANIEILKKRIQHHESARENLQVIDSEIERIENQVDLIRAEAAVNRDPAALSERIDAAAASLGDANQFLRVNESLLGDIGHDPEAPPVRIATPGKTT